MADESMTMRVGTTRWTAPEVLHEEGNYTEKADVYSFGMSHHVDHYRFSFANVNMSYRYHIMGDGCKEVAI